MSVALFTGQQSKQILTIDNSEGGSDLEWQAHVTRPLKTTAFYESVKHLSAVTSINDEGLASSVAPIMEAIYGLAGGTQVLAWIPYVDTYNQYPNILNAISQYYTDYTLTETRTTDTVALAGLLANTDVFLIPNQQGMSSSYYRALGVSWSVMLQNFVSNGGSVIICGGTGYRPLHEIYNSGGLMTMSLAGVIGGGKGLSLNDTTHNLTSELKRPVISQNSTTVMNVFDPEAKVLMNFNGNAALAVKELGLGNLIYIGYNYSTYDNNSASIISKAVSSQGNFNWLSLSEKGGFVTAGSSKSIDVTFDASGLTTRNYLGNIQIKSNDPNNNGQRVPVSLAVTGFPEIRSSIDTLNFGSPLVGLKSVSTFQITNAGFDTLSVSDVIVGNADFVIDTTSFGLFPGGSLDLVVTYIPTSVEIDDTELWILSNDPQNDTLKILLSGTGLAPPIMKIRTDSLSVVLFSGEQSKQVLTIDNSRGESDLVWQARELNP